MHATAKDLRIKSKEILSAIDRVKKLSLLTEGFRKRELFPAKKITKRNLPATHCLESEGSQRISNVDEFIKSVREKRAL